MPFDRLKRREFIALLGGAAAWPISARTQQAMPVIGFLGSQAPGPSASRVAGFVKGLSEAHYVPGENVAIEYRWAEGRYDRLAPLAHELVSRKVAVIAATTQDSALAAKAATGTIPIVFNVGGDPVAFGLVVSMNRPAGNATGVSMFTSGLGAKRLGLLHEMVSNIATVGVLMNPSNATTKSQLDELQEAARSLGVQLAVNDVGSERDLETAIANLVQTGARALFVAADPFLSSQRDRIVALAAKYALPAMYEWPDFVEVGGLMSYSTSIIDAYRQVGVYVGRILAGEKPAELPVLQPVMFELAINLKTAKALGLEVPPMLLARADEVIE
jgi:putative tryptophan/tyrosine transport system substrate-binding protein